MLTTPIMKDSSKSGNKDGLSDDKDYDVTEIDKVSTENSSTPPKAKQENIDKESNNLPRTPTPFKNALAEMGKRRSEL